MDVSKCESCPGFVRYFGYEDVVGHNDIGSIIHDEEVFVSSEAKHFGAVSDGGHIMIHNTLLAVARCHNSACRRWIPELH